MTTCHSDFSTLAIISSPTLCIACNVAYSSVLLRIYEGIPANLVRAEGLENGVRAHDKGASDQRVGINIRETKHETHKMST